MNAFDDYQDFTATTAIYPGPTLADRVAYLGLGIAGEAGEVADKVKKVIRDNGGDFTADAVHDIVTELGDVLWYVTRMADELGVDLSTVARRNQDKLRMRKMRGTLAGSGDNR